MKLWIYAAALIAGLLIAPFAVQAFSFITDALFAWAFVPQSQRAPAHTIVGGLAILTVLLTASTVFFDR